jgi:hypothetical protein
VGLGHTGENEAEEGAQNEQAQWLANAGKGGQIAPWPLMDFKSGRRQG